MPPMSPRTQAMSNPGMPGEEAKALFESGLSQMAYNVLINKLPNVAPDVVTFKVLESDPEMGSGVGAFVVSRRGQTIYVPVVMAENQVKPLDLLYYKELNVFIPLSKDWLEELDKLSLGDLGSGVKAPDTLSTDVDIRNTVIPPSTGRYSYAAAIDQAGAWVDQARNQTTEPKLAFLEFLSKAPNRVKKAAAKLFETRPKLMKAAAEHYGTQNVIDALTLVQEKKADYEGKVPMKGGGLYIANKKTTPGEFKEIFGDKAPLAYQGVALKTYFAKDDRKDKKRAVKIQRFMDFEEPQDAGIYRLHKVDGGEVLALLAPNPYDVFRADFKLSGKKIPNYERRYAEKASFSGDSKYERERKLEDSLGYGLGRFLGVTEDGKLVSANKIVGERVPEGEAADSGVLKKIFSDASKAPKSGQVGMFVHFQGTQLFVTKPVKVDTVTTGSDGVRRVVVTNGYDIKTLVTDPKSSLSRITSPQGSSLAYLPESYVFLPIKAKMDTSDLLQDPRDMMLRATNELEKLGAERVVVKYASDRGWTVGDQVTYRDAMGDFVDALKKVALESGISVEDADHALKQAQELGRFEFWAVPEKTAGEDGPPKKDKKKDSGGGSKDPAGDAMDSVEGTPAPPQPSPVDMAVAEQMQNIQMQMQGLNAQMTLLQQIQMRTQQIAGTGGAIANPAAAAAAYGGPMDPSMTGQGAAPMPQPGMGAPQTGGGAPGQPPAGPAQQGAMGQMGGAQAVMPGQPGMDPSMQQQQQPGATMTADDGSMDSLLAQVNPQFVEQAAGLQDAGAFDAAALSSMAQAPALKDLVAGYLPNLEKSLDNIGRVLLTLWMDESQIKGDIGNETFIELEDNLRTTFKGLGELILRINQNSLIIRGQYEQSRKEL
jgi:hypothetical protein